MIYSLMSGSRSHDGIIGQKSREELKRTPSTIYWNGLRRWGILSKYFTGTLNDYGRQLGAKHKKRKYAGYEEYGDDKKDDKDSMSKLEELFLKSRTIMLYGEINQKVAREFCTKLQLLASESDDDITVYVNSPGGHVESGDSIHDMIKFVKPRVKVVGTGWVASAGALSLPNTRYMLHQPSGGVGGQASDISIEAEQIVKMRERLNQIFADQTGQPIETIAKDTDRNFWMTPEEAKEYGLVGKIIQSKDEL